MSWNYSEAVDRIGLGPMAERTALIHEQQTYTFAELRRRARSIGAWLQDKGLKKHSHVGHYLRNTNAYLEVFFGSGLIGCAHVNINYRYQQQELEHLCHSLDVEVLVYATEFAKQVAEIKPQLNKTIAYVEVTEDGADPVNDFAVSLDDIYLYRADDLVTDTASDNQIIIATGGTTGMPKGTQWEHTGLWHKMKVWGIGAMAATALTDAPDTLDDYLTLLQTQPASKPLLPLCPLMHGTGLMMAICALAQGSPVVTTGIKRFDADHCLNLIKQHQVGSLVIVGDAFALPLLESIEARDDGCFDSVQSLISSGAILSDQSRTRFIQQNPDLVLLDTLGSSETSGFALTTEQAGVFLPMPTTKIFDDNLVEVAPGSDTIGIAYAGGYIPIGYYNEPEKTAATFIKINGERFVKTGDRCTVRKDGLLALLGRDNSVINTGGEKVYTIEVEQLLIRHQTISDALLIGLPHPRFGKMVVAVVEGGELTNDNLDVAALQHYLRKNLADYKVPKKIYAIDSMQRFANGKVDYKMITDFAARCLEQYQPAPGRENN
ncbi:Long-chain-fatty-acid--CoA/3-oxocholest-4-en-26-oate--CoA ligase [Sinobacterium norvegicum]|uniref:Long-chain-fatty-acid--CoA/3-oxocholest-4-en-26-oate--CoA ligase n=1 Tax=Sinobacterium norvegicum TaxID=1641715 RepID=A0ABM9AFY0_9GAMM|nr:AMP-binding protein [Sinobacterium norvegicum]CAH0992116.1 Long-chain-fatty-acid--CoA/3-oxocholest-4-en-26-oate--CoA ligase [Sinobacterium norvegicum]